MRSVDAFQLGYLPQLVRAHLGALEIVDAGRKGAEGELASRVERQLASLRERGPEIVSCVLQIESIFFERLSATPPAPPRMIEEFGPWLAAVVSAVGEKHADPSVYALGAYAGAAEGAVATAVRQWNLWAAKPAHDELSSCGARVRERLHAAAALASASTPCPTMRSEGERIARELAQAVGLAAMPPDDASAEALSQVHVRLQACARSLESAAWGTPRSSVQEWLAQRTKGSELARRLADHRRWSVPCVLRESGPPTVRIFPFDKRVLVAFSDAETLAECPDFVRGTANGASPCVTLPGTLLLSSLSGDDVDVVVFDPNTDPQSTRTLNYPREMYAVLRQTAAEVGIEGVATDWSRLDLSALRAHPYWVLVGGGSVRNLGAPDGHGAARLGLFTNEASLDAHLALATAEQRKELGDHFQRVLLPGEQLFGALRALQVGVVMNPSGPGRSRSLNKQTVEMLARDARC